MEPEDPTQAGVDDTVADAVASLKGAGPVLRPGETVDRYRVDGELGRGALGVVYEAYDPKLNRKVALKLLHPERTHSEHAEVVTQRLVREAQAMAQISHPNVVHVYDVGTQEGQVYVVMEHIDGVSLEVWLKAATRDEAQILDVFTQAGTGLAAAHEAGLVHRDFKPDNVMIDARGRAVVLDFGIARAITPGPRGISLQEGPAPAASTDKTLTTTGALMGTPAYMAPEQFNAEATDARTDQFSFCVALHEALCKQRPFRGASMVELAFNVTTAKLGARPNEIPEPTWAVLRRGLSARPEDRFASMGRVLEALTGPAKVAAAAQGPAPVQVAPFSVDLPALELAEPSPLPEASKAVRSSFAPGAWTLAAILAIAPAVMVHTFRSHDLLWELEKQAQSEPSAGVEANLSGARNRLLAETGGAWLLATGLFGGIARAFRSKERPG